MSRTLGHPPCARRAPRPMRGPLVCAMMLAAFLWLTPGIAAGTPRRFDTFDTLNPAVWHVTDTSNRTTPMDYCPVRCIPANVTTASGQLRISVPPAPSDSGGQIVSRQMFHSGVFTGRFAAGDAQQTLNAMFLYSFATADEVDVEVTYDGAYHEACGAYQPSDRWEIWFTVWKAGACTAHAEFPLADPAAFHDYRIAWQASDLAFTVDGQQLWTAPSLTTTDMQLIFNAYEPPWKGTPAATTSSVMRVERVTVDGGNGGAIGSLPLPKPSVAPNGQPTPLPPSRSTMPVLMPTPDPLPPRR